MNLSAYSFLPKKQGGSEIKTHVSFNNSFSQGILLVVLVLTILYFDFQINISETFDLSFLGAASYQLIVKSSGSGDGTRNIVETSIELTQLSSGTEYEFILHSVGDNETLSSDAAELDETTCK